MLGKGLQGRPFPKFKTFDKTLDILLFTQADSLVREQGRSLSTFLSTSPLSDSPDQKQVGFVSRYGTCQGI